MSSTRTWPRTRSCTRGTATEPGAASERAARGAEAPPGRTRTTHAAVQGQPKNESLRP